MQKAAQKENGVNLPPSVWGPSVWRAIHYIALGFPAESGAATERQKEAYRTFFRNLDRVLPCGKCAENYREHLSKDISPVEDAIEAGSLFEWTVQLHNIVSRSLGKGHGAEMTPEQAFDELVQQPQQNQLQYRKQRHITVFTAISVVAVLIAIILACIVRWVFDIRLRQRA